MDSSKQRQHSDNTSEDAETSESVELKRPRTRAECVNGPRPCPWVGCEHHLLLEIGKAKEYRYGVHRDPGLSLNMPRSQPGRRKHLRSSCAAELVRVWIDEAIEVLWGMPYSCALDVADAGEAGVNAIAELLGRSRTGARARIWAAKDALANGERVDHGDEDA